MHPPLLLTFATTKHETLGHLLLRLDGGSLHCLLGRRRTALPLLGHDRSAKRDTARHAQRNSSTHPVVTCVTIFSSELDVIVFDSLDFAGPLRARALVMPSDRPSSARVRSSGSQAHSTVRPSTPTRASAVRSSTPSSTNAWAAPATRSSGGGASAARPPSPRSRVAPSLVSQPVSSPSSSSSLSSSSTSSTSATASTTTSASSIASGASSHPLNASDTKEQRPAADTSPSGVGSGAGAGATDGGVRQSKLKMHSLLSYLEQVEATERVPATAQSFDLVLHCISLALSLPLSLVCWCF